jgi:hypothetical protein
MSDPLSMSLDQLIEKNSSNKANHNKSKRDGRNGSFSGSRNNTQRSIRVEKVSRDTKANITYARSFKLVQPIPKPTIDPPLIYRPIKINSNSSTGESVYLLNKAQSTSLVTSKNSTVFSRLGQVAPSGTKVYTSESN